jgi:hypothetical protein
MRKSLAAIVFGLAAALDRSSGVGPGLTVERFGHGSFVSGMQRDNQCRRHTGIQDAFEGPGWGRVELYLHPDASRQFRAYRFGGDAFQGVSSVILRCGHFMSAGSTVPSRIGIRPASPI